MSTDLKLDSHFPVAAFVKTPKRRMSRNAHGRHFHKCRYREGCRCKCLPVNDHGMLGGFADLKRHHRNSAAESRSGGSALIVVLWVIGLLSILIGSLAFEAHMEAKITSYYRKRSKAEHLARSGIEIAEMLLIRRGDIDDEQDEPEDEDDRWFYSARTLKKGALRGLTEKLGEGTISIDIIPEPARRNINNLDTVRNKQELEVERNLERIFEVGGITEEMGLWPELVESFLDWIDSEKPEDARTDGAETDDYYATLDPPYEAKNGPLDTVGELLLVKGFSRPILYGGAIETGMESEEPILISGIADLLTTYGSGKLDVNAASMRVLMSLPEMDEIFAGAIIEEREGLLNPEGEQEEDYFKSVSDLRARIPDLPQNIDKYLDVGSGIFRITSIGEVGGVQRRIWCIAEFEKEELKILRWREEED